MEAKDDKNNDKSFEIKIKFFGNEAFAVNLTAGNGSNRWVLLSVLTIFCFLTILGAYGEKFIELYRMLIG